MHSIDDSLVLWLNHLAGRSGTFDGFVKDISDNSLVQAVVPVTILCYFWFRRAMPQTVQVDARLALMSQQNGRWLVLEVNRDITDQRKAEALREEAVARLMALREFVP